MPTNLRTVLRDPVFVGLVALTSLFLFGMGVLSLLVVVGVMG